MSLKRLLPVLLILAAITACKKKQDPQKLTIDIMAKKTLNAWMIKDTERLAAFTHPKKGVRFTPYSYIEKEDVVFSQKQMREFFSDEKLYLWGYSDGSGDEIRVKPSAYYLDWIVSTNFSEADMTVGSVKGRGNSLENTKEVYPDGTQVEFYVPGTTEFGGMDWHSLRFVFEKYEGKWYMVGVVHNSWTT